MIGKSGIWLFGALFLLQSCVQPLMPVAPSGPDCTALRCVAITFDGGPTGNTAAILDILAENRAKATFFVIGKQVERQPELVARMAAEGHEIGNHSWSHVPFPRLSQAQILKELADTDAAIQIAANGYAPRVFRPPYGSYSPRVASIIADAPTYWDLDPNDWEITSSAEIAQQVQQARPGMIVLLHSFAGASLRALPSILQSFQTRGYTMVTVSELRP